MNEEPPYGTIAWYFFKIDEKQKQLTFLLSEVEERLTKIKDLLKEIDNLKVQMEITINVGKI
ncbi:MAG: hypothetical protein RXQ77_04000 [Candidatus Nanopusillus sp.]